ncbi:MAG: DNA adenine methylase [Acidobacteriota bacterium]
MESESTPIPARPARPLAPWLGGKRHLAERIVDRIRAIPHRLYAEPFLGQGGVFLRRPFKAHAEVVNDVNRDLVTMFRVLQRHYLPFVEMMRWYVTSRAEFERLASTPPATLTDLERAARFLYLQRTAFGGKVAGQNFGVSYGPGRFDITRLVPLLEAVHERLAGVTIECLPWSEFLERYDQPGALFYLDPPYWGSEEDYGVGVWRRGDFARLAALLRTLKGRFILSLNDAPEVRRQFEAFHIEMVETTYTVASKSGPTPTVPELLISDRPIVLSQSSLLET